jgi:hypothetical protein
MYINTHISQENKGGDNNPFKASSYIYLIKMPIKCTWGWNNKIIFIITKNIPAETMAKTKTASIKRNLKNPSIYFN